LPYGLDVHEWDKKLTKDQFVAMLRNVRAINVKENYNIAFYCHWTQASHLNDWLMGEGYTNVRVVYVYKHRQNQTGLGFINAVEMMVVATQGTWQTLMFPDKNPQRRHNLMLTSLNRIKVKDCAGKTVNTTEKPIMTSYNFGMIHAPPGGSVLVLGSGCGGDAVGFLTRGLNVTAVDKDPAQVQALWSRVQGLVADWATHEAEFEAERMLVSCDSKLLTTGKVAGRDHMKRLLRATIPHKRGCERILKQIDEVWRPLADGAKMQCAACEADVVHPIFCDVCSVIMCTTCPKECDDCDYSTCSDECAKEHECDGANVATSSADHKK
jgi:hypothetical protein